MIVNKNLQVINSQKESSKIKSGCFDELHSFVYSTSTHIKYMFLDGKTTGTFRSIDQPVYVAFFMKMFLAHFRPPSGSFVGQADSSLC